MNPDEPQPDQPEAVEPEDADSDRTPPRNQWCLWGGLLFAPVGGLIWRVMVLRPLDDDWLTSIIVPWLIITAFSGVVAAWGWSGVAGKTQSRILWTILMAHLTIPVTLIAAGASMCCGR